MSACVCMCVGRACERLFGGSRGGEGPEAGMHVNTGGFPGLTYGFTDLKGRHRATTTVEGPPWDCIGISCASVCYCVVSVYSRVQHEDKGGKKMR